MQKEGLTLREAFLLLKRETEAPQGFVATPEREGRLRIYKDYDDFVWVDVGPWSIVIAHEDDIKGASKFEASVKEIINTLQWGLEDAVFKLNSEGL